jgi:dTDP-4-dehydrorhamnose 3,5-epimerase
MPFSFTQYGLSGIVLVEQQTFADHRGFFKETYKYGEFASAGIEESFLQDNLSVSARDVFRGLHFQVPPKAQAKLVTVIRGAILDVVVDLRKESPTYLQWMALEMAGTEHKALYIPEGFAHGFLTLENDTYVAYKTSAEFSPDCERGIRWNDPNIGIVLPISSPQTSEKDAALPMVDEIEDTPF